MSDFSISLIVSLAMLVLLIFVMAVAVMAFLISQRYKIETTIQAEWQKGMSLTGICLHTEEHKGISIHLIFFSIGFQTTFKTI